MKHSLKRKGDGTDDDIILTVNVPETVPLLEGAESKTLSQNLECYRRIHHGGVFRKTTASLVACTDGRLRIWVSHNRERCEKRSGVSLIRKNPDLRAENTRQPLP